MRGVAAGRNAQRARGTAQTVQAVAPAQPTSRFGAVNLKSAAKRNTSASRPWTIHNAALSLRVSTAAVAPARLLIEMTAMIRDSPCVSVVVGAIALSRRRTRCGEIDKRLGPILGQGTQFFACLAARAGEHRS